MIITRLKLKSFRNHKKREFDFDKDLTIILGPNGSGKTNVLEAINMLSTARSFRAQYDRDLITYGHKFCSIEGYIQSQQEKDLLELQIMTNDEHENSSVKKVRVNKTPKNQSYFCGLFNSVIFTPEDLHLLCNSPAGRRKYMDMVLSQTQQGYKKALYQYSRAMRQRNKVLEQIRDFGKGGDQMDFWNSKILETGNFIHQAREGFFVVITSKIKEKGQVLNNTKQTFEIRYKKSEINPERLEKYKEKEILAKTTLIGPHRDDFEILWEQRNISYFGSRGQQRTTLLALKLAEIEFIKGKTQEDPVLLLDDIFSELDEKHKEAVFDVIKNRQTIVTSTEDPKHSLGGDRINL